MSVLVQERIFHPTYPRLLCLPVRRRGVSLADALAGTGIPARVAECYRVEAIRGLFAPGFKTAANKAAIARLVELLPCRCAKR